MTDQEWRQAADGQWYPVNGRKTKVPTWAGIAAAGVVCVLIVVVVLVSSIAGDDAPNDTPSEAQTRAAMNSVWAGMSTSERVDFCAEARAAGYHVVSGEIGRGFDRREVRYWLEDTCG